MSLIQSWIIYIGRLGGGGAGGTGYKMATGFSVSIFLISLNVTPLLAVRKTKLYHHIYHKYTLQKKDTHRSDSFLISS